MEGLQAFAAFIVSILLRFVIPLGITVLVIALLRRIDLRWQSDADKELARLKAQGYGARNVGCWEINKCTPAAQAKCKARAHVDTPCWQVFRNSDGLLQEKCLGCQVFKEAPVPVISGD